MVHAIETITATLASQRAAFERQPRRPLDQRRADLRKLEAIVLDDPKAWIDAVSQDFGHRAATETQLLELSAVARAASGARRQLGRWMAPTRVATPPFAAPGRSLIRHEPKGVVGVVSPWNYPIQLSLMPLVAALSAGCRTMIKPSELTPATNALLAERLAARFPEDQVTVVEGGPEVAEAFCAQAFDHLFYTGSTAIGRKVAAAAAQTLTPLTLELGGKSPVLVDPDYPLKDLVHPLAWGRFLNAGQTCVAPDHVLSIGDGDRTRQVAEAVMAQAQVFYPDFCTNPDYTSIIADRHFQRLEAMVEEARAAGVVVLQPAHDPEAARRNHRFPPTVMIDPPKALQVMQEEIFGPILPVLTCRSIDDAVETVNASGRPLALYAFSKRGSWVDDVLDRTLSGGVTVNGTMLHLANENLPFGGVGSSGYGAYRGRRGFEEFSHARSVFATRGWHSTRLAAPPYGRLSQLISRLAVKL